MKRLSILLWVPVILFSACAFALDVPSSDEILQKAAENSGTRASTLHQYTYQIHQEIHKANGDGTAGRLIHSRDWDVIFLGGHRFFKPVLIDGKPLDPKQVEQLNVAMKKAAERNRSEGDSGKVESGEYVRGHNEYDWGGLREALRLKDSRVLREEEVNGRKAWVIQSEPKKDASPTSSRDEQLLCYRDLYWIDQQDLVIAKVEIHVLREYLDPKPRPGVARPLKPGSFVRTVFVKADGSAWLPQNTIAYLRRKYPLGTISFRDDRIVVEETQSNYKKFDVKTTMTFAPDQQ
jgi:hypothetical protein